jgi:hypothetical protein
MAKTPFKLKSGNSTPFKQMGSFPMTRSQARSLTERHMKDGKYEQMRGESRFQMHQRLRRAGKSNVEGYWKYKDDPRVYHTSSGETEFFKDPESYYAHREAKGLSKDFKTDLKTIKRGTETYLGKHLEAEKVQRAERKVAGDVFPGLGKEVKKRVKKVKEEVTTPIIDTPSIIETEEKEGKTTFPEAFKIARKAQGAGGTFEWEGKTFTTDYADE